MASHHSGYKVQALTPTYKELHPQCIKLYLWSMIWNSLLFISYQTLLWITDLNISKFYCFLHTAQERLITCSVQYSQRTLWILTHLFETLTLHLFYFLCKTSMYQLLWSIQICLIFLFLLSPSSHPNLSRNPIYAEYKSFYFHRHPHSWRHHHFLFGLVKWFPKKFSFLLLPNPVTT